MNSSKIFLISLLCFQPAFNCGAEDLNPIESEFIKRLSEIKLQFEVSPDSISTACKAFSESLSQIKLQFEVSPQSISTASKAFSDGIKKVGNQASESISDIGTGAGNGLGNMGPGLIKLGQSLGEAMKPFSRVIVKSAIGATAGVVTILLAKHLTQKYINRYAFEPKLIQKKSSRGFLSFFRRRKQIKLEDHMIISDSLAADLNYIMNMTKNVKKHGGQFENVLLYGAPGTGKTLFAELLAEHCGMDYAIIPAANISQFMSKGTVVEELNNLFEWAARSKRGTIIFLDEVENFLADRSTLSSVAYDALSAFLAKTGTPSKKIMIISTTNRPQAIDSAALDRHGLQIEFPLPTDKERQAQLEMHINKIFLKQKGSFVKYDYLKKQANIAKISAQLDGCSGRTVQKFVARLRQFALSQDCLEIKPMIVDAVVTQIKKAVSKS